MPTVWTIRGGVLKAWFSTPPLMVAAKVSRTRMPPLESVRLCGFPTGLLIEIAAFPPKVSEFTLTVLVAAGLAVSKMLAFAVNVLGVA